MQQDEREGEDQPDENERGERDERGIHDGLWRRMINKGATVSARRLMVSLVAVGV